MGGLLRDLEHLEEAEALGAEAVERARRALPDGHWYRAVFLGGYGKTLLLLDRHAKAEAALLEACEVFEAALGAEHKRTIDAIESLADLYDTWHAAEPDAGYDTKAAEWRAKFEKWQATTQPTTPVPATTQPASQPASQPATP